MAWDDASEIIVASGGELYVAPVGTALPTTPTAALNAAFIGTGYFTEDGVTVTVTPDISEFRAWQSQQAVRRERKAQQWQMSGALEQWNEETIVRAFGGGSVTSPSTGVYRYELPEAGDALDEFAVVLDAIDGARRHRWVIARANVLEAVEFTYKADDMAILPITIGALAPTDGSAAVAFLTDDAAAFAAGS